MKHRCVVVDDEKPARDRVKQLLAAHPTSSLRARPRMPRRRSG